ncbi:UNVERIFIED_CONTAM: transposase [Acetivibrio alkalicellulosi]
MIRVFKLLFKINFKNILAKDFFLQFMKNFNPSKYICPNCKAKHPDWKKYCQYNRYLINYENESVVYNLISVTRYQCSSCGRTHAILPELIVPYRSYTFLFILQVIKDYFSKSLTVSTICEKYNISVSTLYTWKSLFLLQKKLWLGLLKDIYISSIQFLESLLFTHYPQEFFLMTAISFLQSYTKTSKYNPP